jgi:hypothetical protein
MFLGLFWMTAPLAWLYAIPYERFLSPVDATAANLATLGLVALWRVDVMIRVVSVLMGYGLSSAAFLVMALADMEVLIALQFLPVPLIDLMGGIRLTESEALMKKVACSVCQFASFSLPVWLIGAVVVRRMYRPNWQGFQQASPMRASDHSSIWIMAWSSLVVWVFILPFTQPEQQLCRRVERDLKEGRIAAALAEMSKHSPEDFPPHWDPPPKAGFHGQDPPLVTVIESIADDPPAPWVRAIYMRKFEDYLRWKWLGDDDGRIVRLLQKLPEGPELRKLRSDWRTREPGG